MYDLDDIRLHVGHPVKVRDVHLFTYWAVLHEVREFDRRIILTLRGGRQVAVLVREIVSLERLTHASYREALANLANHRHADVPARARCGVRRRRGAKRRAISSFSMNGSSL